MRKLLLALSRVFARYGLWSATVLTLYAVGPLTALDTTSRGRLLYAALMSRNSALTRFLFERMELRDRDTSPDANFALAAFAQRLGQPERAAELYRGTLLVHAHPHERALAQIMASLCDDFATGTIDSLIAGLVNQLNLPPGQDLIVVTAGSRYLDLFNLWHEQAQQHLEGHLVALALDSETVAALRHQGIGSILDLSPWFVFEPSGKIHERSRNTLWILRVLILRTLVDRGHQVLSIDLDAVPVGNLNRMLTTLPQADVIAQQDYSIPADVARKLGFILCCGFLLLRPTPATKAFLARYGTRTMLELDDQLAINHLIAEAKIYNRNGGPNYFTFESDGVLWLCPDKSLVSRDIAYGSVVRHFQQQGETIGELRAQLGLTPAKPQ